MIGNSWPSPWPESLVKKPQIFVPRNQHQAIPMRLYSGRKSEKIGPFTREKRWNGPDRNKHSFQQNLTVYKRKFCQGMDKRKARSSKTQGMDKDHLQIVL